MLFRAGISDVFSSVHVDIVDVIAPGTPMQAAARTIAARAHLLQRAVGKAEMKGGLLGGEEGAGLARGLRAIGGVIHGSRVRRRDRPNAPRPSRAAPLGPPAAGSQIAMRVLDPRLPKPLPRRADRKSTRLNSSP